MASHPHDLRNRARGVPLDPRAGRRRRRRDGDIPWSLEAAVREALEDSGAPGAGRSPSVDGRDAA